MAEMEWLQDIEDRWRVNPEHCIRKLITAVGLAEKGFQELEGSGGLLAVRKSAGAYLARLRSGEVEEK